MRVLIDTNVFIGYLLGSSNSGTIRSIFYAFLEKKFTLLVPHMLLKELQYTVLSKAKLTQRITEEDLVTFIEILSEFGESVDEIQESIPQVTRDPKDDYLLVCAVSEGADYLVTGDKDLLVLYEEIKEIDIVTPSQFLTLLNI